MGGGARPCPGHYSVLCTGGWVGPRVVWTGIENQTPTVIRSLDRPVCSKLLYQLHYPGPSLQSEGCILIVLHVVIKIYAWSLDMQNNFRYRHILSTHTHTHTHTHLIWPKYIGCKHCEILGSYSHVGEDRGLWIWCCQLMSVSCCFKEQCLKDIGN
jgi:hypothetical protein